MRPPPFQALLDAHGDEVHRFLRAAVGADAVDDCFQETFLAALRAYPRLRHGAELRAWILTIARRKAIDAHRAAARRPVPVEGPEPPAPDGTPEPARPDLWRAVRALPERQRTAVTLRYVCDLTYADAARAMGCSEDAARRSVFEGLRRLRREVDDGR